MYHKVVGGECGLRFIFFFFNHPVSPRLRAAFLRRLTNAEAACSVSVSMHFCLSKTQPAFLIVRLEKVHSFEENSFEVHGGPTIVCLSPSGLYVRYV